MSESAIKRKSRNTQCAMDVSREEVFREAKSREAKSKLDVPLGVTVT